MDDCERKQDGIRERLLCSIEPAPNTFREVEIKLAFEHQTSRQGKEDSDADYVNSYS